MTADEQRVFRKALQHSCRRSWLLPPRWGCYRPAGAATLGDWTVDADGYLVRSRRTHADSLSVTHSMISMG
jgi:hypothetical protein